MKQIFTTCLVFSGIFFFNFKADAQWSLTGNSTTEPNNVIGTTNDADVVFKRWNSPAMTIKNVPTTAADLSVVYITHGIRLGSTKWLRGANCEIQLDKGIELGSHQNYASPNKEFDAGKIIYKGSSEIAHSLSIYGGGTSTQNRMIKFYNEGGATFTGKVAIGARQSIGDHGDYKLSVDGKIVAQSIAVTVDNTTNWADFVFKKDYKLTPLLEVEKYIKREGHLRGVPTTEEVMKDGLDLAQMNARLLEKVEELTLYMIELKKANDQMKKDIEVLKAVRK